MDFVDFLVEAKKNTYASEKRAEKVDDQIRRFIYESREHTYTDIWTMSDDERRFFGCEIVLKDDGRKWFMQYNGGLTPDCPINLKDNTYAFLRRALSSVNNKFPFRGPMSFGDKRENLTYYCEVKGNVDEFRGRESIFTTKNDDERTSVVLYGLEFMGGFLDGRN